jgi:tetratricopeptide (TPR) repeat protein
MPQSASSNRLLSVLTMSLALWLCAATPGDWLRRGNAAYARGDYPEAVEMYRRAEPTIADPGLVSFNLAATHYQMNQFAEAEAYYRRALEDANGVRRVEALYGLGNARARLGDDLNGNDAVRKLLEAKQSYESCLDLEIVVAQPLQERCQSTFTDARFNLRLLEPLLAKKRLEAAHAQPDAGPTGDAPGARPPGSGNDHPRGNGGQRHRGTAEPGNETPLGHGSDTPHAGSPRPGKGNLPPLLDDQEAPALDSEQAMQHLLDQLERIHRDRARRGSAASDRMTGARDW